jgi:6-phosphogluconolactonase
MKTRGPNQDSNTPRQDAAQHVGLDFSAGGIQTPARRKHMNLQTIKTSIVAVTVSAAMVLGLTSCSLDYVVGYVYMTTAKTGVIDQYSIDFQSGALTSIGTPIAAGNDPVRIVSSPSGKFVYSISQLDSKVWEFAVQGDGTLGLKNTYALTGTLPTALAIDPQGAYLYVAVKYQAGFSAGTPGPGVVNIFPVNSDNSLGTVSTVNVGNNPVGVSVSYFNHYVYVLDQETAILPQILGFSQSKANGSLTPVSGTVITTVAGKTVATGYAAGVTPSAIAEEPTSRFVYVTDQAANQLIGYTVSSNGALVPMINGPFQTGLFPVAITVDPTGKLLFVANYNSNSVEGFAIDLATGTPSGAVGSFATPVGAGPSCVAVDPALGTNLYTSNSLDNTISGEKLSPNTGSLVPVQNTPFLANGSPTCLTVVPNGAHASQIITP